MGTAGLRVGVVDADPRSQYWLLAPNIARSSKAAPAIKQQLKLLLLLILASPSSFPMPPCALPALRTCK